MGKKRNVDVSSPLHRDPDTDGDDYGACGDRKAEANAAVAVLVESICDAIEAGTDDFLDGDDVLETIQTGLEKIEHETDGGVTDTIVKENVRNAIAPTAEECGLEIDWERIYGW